MRLFFFKWRDGSKIRTPAKETNLYQTGHSQKRNVWINCEYSALSRWSFKIRAQFSTYNLNGQTTRGLALIQDVNFDLDRFSFWPGTAFFKPAIITNRLYLS